MIANYDSVESGDDLEKKDFIQFCNKACQSKSSNKRKLGDLDGKVPYKPEKKVKTNPNPKVFM